MTQIGNSGRLAARATVLQNHVDGVALQHEADVIILDPPIEINGGETSTVRIAISSLTDYIDEINVDATTAESGFITLTNDLGGTGSAPKVIQITGNSNQLNITPRNLVFGTDGSTDIEIKYNENSSDPKGIKLISQSVLTSLSSSVSGGDITIQTGNKNILSSLSKPGKVFININTTNVFTAKGITNNSRIISLFGEATTTNIPGEANNSLFLFDASVDPASTPVGGSHLYSLDGKVRVKNVNADVFDVGNTPATWVNNLESFGAINKVTTVTTQGDSPETLFQYEHTSGNACTIIIETTIIAKLDGDSHTYKYIASFYSTDGLTFNQIGSTDQIYFETEAISPIGTNPVINTSGAFITIDSGHDAYIIKWYANTKLHIIE